MDEHRPLYPRLLSPRVAEALADTPVVFLAGSRQAGKTALARPVRYLTLDDDVTLLAAREDPVGMVRRERCEPCDNCPFDIDAKYVYILAS